MKLNINTKVNGRNKALSDCSSNYSIRVIDDMYDPALVRHWKRIEEEADCFPQMYYEWCEPWWRLQSGKRELHIVAVEDENNRVVGIAPLCIEKNSGLRILRNLPIHFGDFYFFLIEKGASETNIIHVIIDHLRSFLTWQVVHFVNINDRSALWDSLTTHDFSSKPLTNILVADFSNMAFEDYLKSLSRNTRQQFGKKLRRFEKEGEVTLECVDQASGYMAYASHMKHLYSARWADDHSLPPDDAYYQCRNEAVQALFEKKKMALYVLKLDNEIKIFRLGFMHNRTFYDWKVSHDPSIDYYSPGILIIGKIVEDLTFRKYVHLNFMTGDYGYKRSWATEGLESANCEFFACGTSVRAKLYMKYRLEWRDRLRNRYYVLLEIGWIRSTKRWLQAQFRQLKS